MGLSNQVLGEYEKGMLKESEFLKNMDSWNSVFQRGCRLVRHDNSRESALNIISSLLLTNRKWKLRIQKVMVDEGKSLEVTAAGLQLSPKFHSSYAHFLMIHQRGNKLKKYSLVINNLKKTLK